MQEISRDVRAKHRPSVGFDLENWICRPNTWSRSNLFFTLFNWGPPSPVSSGSGPRLMENICTWKQHSIVGMMFVLTPLYQVLLLQAVQRKQKLLIIWCVVANTKLSILNFQVNHSFRRFGLVCSKLWMGVEPANPYMYTISYMIYHKIQKLHSKKMVHHHHHHHHHHFLGHSDIKWAWLKNHGAESPSHTEIVGIFFVPKSHHLDGSAPATGRRVWELPGYRTRLCRYAKPTPKNM